MSSAFLLGLLGVAYAQRREDSLHQVGLVSHHHGNVLGGRDPRGRVDHMLDERESTRAMQDLGALRFHPRSQAGGQDYYAQRRCHSVSYYFKPMIRILDREALPRRANSSATSAVALESWRTTSPSASRSRETTCKPISVSRSTSLTTDCIFLAPYLRF